MSIFQDVINDLQGLYSDLKLDESGKTARKQVTLSLDLVLYEDRDPKDWEVVDKKTKAATLVNDVTGAPKLISLEFISKFNEFMKEASKTDPIANLKDGGFEISDGAENAPVESENTPVEVTQEPLSEADKLARLDAIMDGKVEPVKPSKSVTKKEIQVSRAPVIQNKYNFSDRQLQAIKDTVAKGASDSEFEMLMYLANRYQLDPILKEIFYSPQLKTIMTSRDGYLKIAHRSQDFKGIQSMAVCENDDFELDVPNCSVKHKFGKGDRGKVIGAWAIVYREGMMNQLAWAATKEQLNNNPAWKYVSAMSCKCAENFALKRAFSISGLVTQEEFGMEDNEIVGSVEIIDADYQEVQA